MKRLNTLTATALCTGYASADAPKVATGTKAPTTTDAFAITPPPSNNRGSTSPLRPKFEGLDVGQAFGVTDRTKKQIQGTVSNMNRKFKSVATDAEGNESTLPGHRHFKVFDVDANYAKTLKGTPLDGAKTLVFRDA